MSTKKEILIAAAMSGMAISVTNLSYAEPVTQEVEKCYGINKCKGLTSCEVNKDHIAAANKAFNNKFKKTKPYECAHNIPGSAKQGYLGWLYVAVESCHKIDGGFLINEVEENVGGKKSVKFVVDKG